MMPWLQGCRHRVVGQAHLPRARNVTAADQSGIGKGVMWRPQRPLDHKGLVVSNPAALKSFLALQGLLIAEKRQDSRESYRLHEVKYLT